MNASQVAHVWAQQTKPKGGSGNFYFVGDTIYSYGRHFPIARFVSPDVVLFTSRGYSKSTACHKSTTMNAIGHKTVYTVHNVNASTKAEHVANFQNMRDEIEAALIGIGRKRDKSAEFVRIKRLADSANAYAVAFKLKERVTLPDDFAKASADALAAKETRDRANARKIAARARKEQRERDKALADWLAGKIDRIYGMTRDDVRLRINGDKVETTMGAEFPVSHCRRVWQFIQRIRQRATEWHKNGECCPVGLYQIESIDASGNVVAGCHRVKFAEVERLAKLLELA